MTIKKQKIKVSFSRIFGGLIGSSESDVKEKSSVELPSPSAIKAMKKADIVSTAKEHGLELDITNTKAQLLESWENHFSNDDSPSAGMMQQKQWQNLQQRHLSLLKKLL